MTSVLDLHYQAAQIKDDDMAGTCEEKKVYRVLVRKPERYLGVLYCIVVGFRRLMPPDALQPKAYCTNPGLWSLLLAPPGVSTRDPSSERRNYLGKKRPMNFA